MHFAHRDRVRGRTREKGSDDNFPTLTFSGCISDSNPDLYRFSTTTRYYTNTPTHNIRSFDVNASDCEFFLKSAADGGRSRFATR